MKKDILNYMRETFGIEGAEAEELFASFMKTVTENIAKLEQPSQDFEALARAAHSIKGCALNCGQTEMAEAARAVEFAAKASDFAYVRQLLPRLKSFLEKLSSEK